MDVGMQEIKPAVQVVSMADDPHSPGGISGSIAAAHIVADFMRPEVGYQIFNQFGGAVAAVAVVAALASFRVRYNCGQCAAIFHHHNSGGGYPLL